MLRSLLTTPMLRLSATPARSSILASTGRSLLASSSAISVNGPVLMTAAVRTTATTGCRRKKKKVVEVVDDRLSIKDAVTILNARTEAVPNRDAINANIKVRSEKGMPPIRGTLILPEKVSKQVRILCFAEGPAAKAATAAGADIVGTTELLDGIQRGTLQYDMVISTPEAFPIATRVAKILGPKGLMPNAKKGTVTTDIATTIDTLKNSIRYTSGRAGNVNVTIGRVGFTPEQIERNLTFVMNEVLGYTALIPGKKKVKRNKFVHKVWMSATHAPSLPLRLTQFTW
ncbi:ribosomal protein L1-like protein [Blastocladiella britannica]|nr:ribosomal protein L1-like protein [Blastocladiella britannica]